MEQEFVTITAVDKQSSDSISRSFSVSSDILLKAMVLDWEKKNVSYRRYSLVTQDFLEEFSEEIQTVLEDLEVEN